MISPRQAKRFEWEGGGLLDAPVCTEVRLVSQNEFVIKPKQHRCKTHSVT